MRLNHEYKINLWTLLNFPRLAGISFKQNKITLKGSKKTITILKVGKWLKYAVADYNISFPLETES